MKHRQSRNRNWLPNRFSLNLSRFPPVLGNEAVVTICPYHYAVHITPQGSVITVVDGNLLMALLALSFNAWGHDQAILSAASRTGVDTRELVQRLRDLPESLQKRAIAAIYGDDGSSAGSFTSSGNRAGSALTSTGMHGFTEQGSPDGYDTAAGSVLGYRTWDAHTEHADAWLTGAYGYSWEARPAERRYTATCRSRGCASIPNEDNCGCGFWAYWEPLNASETSRRIAGVIEGSGKVILGDRGFRSQYAVIRGLAVRKSRRGTDDEARILKALRVWYDVPVYDGEDELCAALGTDTVYSPAARITRELTAMPAEDLRSYAVLLSGLAAVAGHCIYGHAFAPGITSLAHQCGMRSLKTERTAVLAVLPSRPAQFRDWHAEIE
jgi:hypothetical protein